MQFHEYVRLRNRVASLDIPFSKTAKSMDSPEFRQFVLQVSGQRLKELDNEWASSAYDTHFHTYIDALTEDSWVKLERPYYNVWPLTMSLAASVKLDLPFSAVEIPFEALLLRFARGREFESLATSMLYWNKEFVGEYSYVQANSFPVGSPDFTYVRHLYKPNDIVEEWIAKNSQVASKELGLASQLIRLFVFIGLLSHDRDFVTPVVLSKDRAKYHATDDESVRKWLEDRAARRVGRGFDVGKKLQEQKDKSPHWRNPHLALFWTGPGRTKPIIKMRSGAVIQRVSMAEVPTGYLGPETEEEDKIDDEKTPRESIPKSKRFEILKRDGYKCQLCGRSQDDGVKLQVDHRVPRAKGGSNDDDNLWTLCDECNLGKSDRDL